MPIKKPTPPLFGNSSSSQITPLSAHLRKRLLSAMQAQVPIRIANPSGIPDIPRIAAAHGGLNPLLNCLPSSRANEPATHGSTAADKVGRWLRGKWRYVAGAALAAFLVGNGEFAWAILGTKQKAPRAISGAVIAASPASVQSEVEILCARANTQTISSHERDELLFNVVNEYETGRRVQSLALLRHYVDEACDAATAQAVLILERELHSQSNETVR